MPNNARAGGELPPPEPTDKDRPPGRWLRLRRSRRRGDDYDEVDVVADGWSALVVLAVIAFLGGAAAWWLFGFR